MFVNGYPYTDFHEMNLDWIIEEFKKVHQELVDAKLYVDNGKLYIDGKLADATYQVSLAEIAKTAAQSAQALAENARDSAANSATAAAGSATAAAGSATQAAQTVANTLSQVSLLQSRVDNIIPSGTQTEGNTELIDIRVGANGVTYSSAGDAVRGQVTNLKNVFETLGLVSFNPEIVLNDGIVNTQGNIESSTNYSYSDPIPVKKGDIILLYAVGYNKSIAMISLCDENNEEKLPVVISNSSSLETYTCTIHNSGYICVCYANAHTSTKLTIYRNKDSENDAVNEAIKTESEVSKIKIVKKMVYRNNYSDHTNYCCTPPIKLVKGQKIKAVLWVESVVQAISKSDSIGNIVSPILMGKGASYQTYEYVAQESEEYVVLCFYIDRLSNTEYTSNTAIAFFPVYDTLISNFSISNFSMFENWGIIGDSFASGVFIDASTGKLANHLQKSWAQILARQSGNNCVNFSMGGLYCGSWLTNTDRGLPFMLSEPAKELYIVALGINDVGKLGTDQPLGTIADIHSDYSQNPYTFYGNYGKILGNIAEHAPKAKIILSTIPYTSTYAMLINNAIIAIAEKYGLPCLMIHEDMFFRSAYYWSNFEENHPKSFIYGQTANAYNRLICENIHDNVAYWGNTFN